MTFPEFEEKYPRVPRHGEFDWSQDPPPHKYPTIESYLSALKIYAKYMRVDEQQIEADWKSA